jgi:molecular chaperone GrpE
MQGDEDETEETNETPPPELPETATSDAPADDKTYTELEMKAAVDAALADSKDRVLRVHAEYENFRRRVQKEKEQWASEAIERFVVDLLGVLDDFDRALAANTGAADAVVQGIRITEKQLRATLSRHGVECVDPAGRKFDPKLHEAIQRVPPSETSPPGTVVVVFEKGYVLKGKLLRAARVQVAGDS